ncbi:Cytosine/adenosine deaminase [Nitrosospira sp. Nl5]|uniref:amidohydrolase family protein n=1 Tax=Nitrosospira sp. Nl5 TaxID=200120 RepID=UPI00088F83D7|nr:amidohydrolase family protein [Nitrosospira sp. Nl5]SCX95798.1 Cytosine/adenosine deaminase [Nitrosospira sp. Nl5]
MSLVLAGRIVPLSRDTKVARSETASFQGKVWIGDDGRIAAVTKGTRGSRQDPAGFETAPVVDAGNDLVVPGFIDLHSHLAYATLPLWVEPGRTEPFLHHNTWPTRPTYPESITWPAYAFIEAAPAELLAYAEIRALIGGTTSIQGSPPSNRPLDGWLVRNIEDETLRGEVGRHQILASTLTLKSEQLGERATRMRQGATFIYHCAEGRPGSIAQREYLATRTAGCLQRELVAIHTNAVDPAAYGTWQEPGAIVWSPFSNLWLYGTTTDVPAALARGITLCVGSDWGPSGTRNVLGELKVASLVSEAKGWGLAPLDLVKMITANPGDVLARAWQRQAGRLQPGALGDVAVIAAGAKGGARGDPFKTILHATEADVRLVVVDGRPLYGTKELMEQAGATRTSEISLGGQPCRLALTRFDAARQPWSFKDILKRLEEVRDDPKTAIENSRRRAFAAVRAGGAPPLRLALDMPTGRVPVGGLPKNLGTIVVPPIQPLMHERAFFSSIPGRGFHGGLLDGLADFYA